MRTTPRWSQRGTSLFEALIAFLVLSLGMIAIARTESTLQRDLDIARQRSDASWLAQQELEAVRGLRPLGTLTTASRSIDAEVRFLVTRQIETLDLPSARAATVTVTWTPRGGIAQQLVLHSIVDGTDPALSGAFALGAALASPSR